MNHLGEFSEEEREKFKEAFSLFDKDGDGTITAKELGTVMRSLGQNPTKEELDIMIAEVDEDKSGEIDFDEFLLLMSQQMKEAKDPDEEFKEAFREFDRDKDEKISKEELLVVLENYGEKFTPEEIDEVFRDIDTEGIGGLSYDAFVNFLVNK